MNCHLFNKIVVISGVSSGLGKSLIRGFVNYKAKVAGLIRTEDLKNKILDDFEYDSNKPLIIKCDLSKPQDISKAVNEIVEFYGTIDILINNAAVNFSSPAVEQTIDEWEETIKINLTAPFLLSRLSYEHLKKNKNGLIINIASIEGFLPLVNHPSVAYSVSKSGLIQLTKALALEWGKDNIRIIAIAPGAFPSKMTNDFFYNNHFSQEREDWVNKTPLKRSITLDELTQSIICLTSPSFSFSTGSVFTIDGGYSSGF